jgi:hypothetical protein
VSDAWVMAPEHVAAMVRENASSVPQVGSELVEWAERLASRFEGVHGDQWQRTGYRSDGAAFTVESFARYLIHDPVHHLWDVEGGQG